MLWARCRMSLTNSFIPQQSNSPCSSWQLLQTPWGSEHLRLPVFVPDLYAKLLISLLTRPRLLAVVAVGRRESALHLLSVPARPCPLAANHFSAVWLSAHPHNIGFAVRQAGLKLWAESRGTTWQLLWLPVVHSSGSCSAPPPRVPGGTVLQVASEVIFFLVAPAFLQVVHNSTNLMLPLKYSVLVRPFSRPLLERPT